MEMMQEDTRRTWEAALGAILQRAARDPQYRQLCLTDAPSAFRAVGEFEPPSDMKVRFIEPPEELIVVLPPAVSDEMSTDELDTVAGGGGVLGLGGIESPIVYPQIPYPQMMYYPYYPSYPPPGLGPDSSTVTGLPPMVRPGGPPPGY